MSETADVVVIGAGVIGLACARALALRGYAVLVLERHDRIGTETSSRNSEVIHAGIYYPSGSRKAELCVAGKALLYAYCERAGVAHRRCGKLIVATDPEQVPVLRSYQAQALRNGAGALEWLDAGQVATLEPAVRAVAGVLSPSTGIIDSHGYMLALQADLEAAGGMVVCNTAVRGLTRERTGIRVVTDDLELSARWVVNCAGLAAPLLARELIDAVPRARFARGRYYGYAGRTPFGRLVYPIAEPGGLGIHVTLDLSGQVRFGPDVEWIDTVDYTFDDNRRGDFIAAIARYFPAVEADRITPAYTGIRPKISAPNEPAADFLLEGPDRHGVPGFLNLLGIESPGLTASLAIAEHVAEQVGR